MERGMVAGVVVLLGAGCSSTLSKPADRETSRPCIEGEWQALPSPPPELVGRNDQAAEVVNGKIFVGLGEGPSGKVYGDWWEYDPVRGTRNRRVNFPGIPRNLAMSFVLDGKISVVGGDTGPFEPYLQDGYVYDPSTDTWSPMDPQSVLFEGSEPPARNRRVSLPALMVFERDYIFRLERSYKTGGLPCGGWSSP